ncbi:enoyl-CoA hydratase [Streptomyces sp. NPDC002143]
MTGVLRTDIDGVAVLTLDDPARRNVLSPALVSALVATVEACEKDSSVSAVVITGGGPAFCAGAELDNLLAAASGEEHRLRTIYEGFLRVARCAMPTVAAVGGPAVGAGLNLALACDVRIAAEDARFDSRFGTLGLHPGGGHTWMLDRLVGRQTAAAMLLFGEVLDGPRAVAEGLALRCVPRKELLDAAVALASGATRAPRELIPEMTASLREAASTPDFETAVENEFTRQVASLHRPDFLTRVGRARSARPTDPASANASIASTKETDHAPH